MAADGITCPAVSFRRIAAHGAATVGASAAGLIGLTVFPWVEWEQSYQHQRIKEDAIWAGSLALDAMEPERMKNGRLRAAWRDEIDFEWDGIPEAAN
jgi:hypothetical protein